MNFCLFFFGLFYFFSANAIHFLFWVHPTHILVLVPFSNISLFHCPWKIRRDELSMWNVLNWSQIVFAEKKTHPSSMQSTCSKHFLDIHHFHYNSCLHFSSKVIESCTPNPPFQSYFRRCIVLGSQSILVLFYWKIKSFLLKNDASDPFRTEMDVLVRQQGLEWKRDPIRSKGLSCPQLP